MTDIYKTNWITRNLAAGRAPMSYAELDTIKEEGIDAIVNLCAEFSDLHELEKKAGFEVYYLPVWDEDTPKMDDMEKALAWLDEAIYLGKKILVHCRHGIGRTGTFITSFMIRKGIGLKAASIKLKSHSANPSNYGQWKLVKKYNKQSGMLKIREPSLEFNNKVDLSPFFSDYDDLIEKVDEQLAKQPDYVENRCGKESLSCCYNTFEISFIEAIYLHSRMNRQFSSAKREKLINKALEFYQQQEPVCPLSSKQGCGGFEFRPVRCRIFGVENFTKDRDEVLTILSELSQTVFLAFSGKFQPDIELSFLIADTISGKFVQKYFDFMLKKKTVKNPIDRTE